MFVRKRPTNSAVASGIGTSEPGEESWLAFDRLPRSVRKMLWEAPVAINPLDAAAFVKRWGVDNARIDLGQAIGEEVLKFHRQHIEKYGYALPAVTSGVAPQRYGAAIGCAKRCLGRPILRAKRKRRQTVLYESSPSSP